jgi:UDP-2,4-diacetamido-2,4,6-trideoxy-beta-L-altropyranose hydrolase
LQNGGVPRVLIALGGGPRYRHALALARAIRNQHPDVAIRIAGGFTEGQRKGRSEDRPTQAEVWLPPLPTLREELSAASVAVVAGGVTLYEACCLGVPSVAVAVSTLSAQRHTVEAAAAIGVTCAGGALGAHETPTRVAAHVQTLLNRSKLRADLARAGRRVVDGRGARRIARALGRLARNQQ